MLTTLLSFFVTLGILITFHELGHYWVARWCGVRVLRFSVGFGKVLIKRVDKNGTEWALSAIPLGGYVKMLDQDDLSPTDAASSSFSTSSASTATSTSADSMSAGKSVVDPRGTSFQSQPVSKRFAIVAAGPLFNLILAALLYAGLNFVGTQEPEAILAQPAASTPAAQAGLQAGDKLVAINQTPVASWPQVRWNLLQRLADGGEVQLTIEQGGAQLTRTMLLPSVGDPSQADPMRDLGLSLASGPPFVRGLVEGSVAQRAGLETGDQIIRINAINRPDTGTLIKTIQQHAGREVDIEVLRNGQALKFALIPNAHTLENGQTVGRAGIQLGADVAMVNVRYGLFESLINGTVKTFDTAWFSLKMMGRMLTGEVSLKNISGPVTIADYAGQTAKIGWAAYVAFLALVSVSLGILNLLPIPMLDGGHLLYYLIEMVRGKPPSALVMEWGQRVGISLLGGLMVLALFNDLLRIFS
ncbi:RIP metalloprotease RseP [Zwartia vadi]|uniref:RIP metalloprotease RseP n=1 Tax=Zwartia vadi TaxID=3058168 RepID=UPI0025B38614|nr:RIP metalloprotease RseP [Zwartia vadi]MDN3986479.1 RIP metalloprotease RseP [Zwartia vadi]